MLTIVFNEQVILWPVEVNYVRNTTPRVARVVKVPVYVTGLGDQLIIGFNPGVTEILAERPLAAEHNVTTWASVMS